MLEFADDIVIDIPKALNHVAALLAPLLDTKMVPLTYLTGAYTWPQSSGSSFTAHPCIAYETQCCRHASLDAMLLA